MAEKEEKQIPPKAPTMKCLHQYIRDLSFENIAAQKNLGDSSSPEINVQVNLDARKGDSDNYEVILKLTVNADSKENKVFLFFGNIAQKYSNPTYTAGTILTIF